MSEQPRKPYETTFEEHPLYAQFRDLQKFVHDSLVEKLNKGKLDEASIREIVEERFRVADAGIRQTIAELEAGHLRTWRGYQQPQSKPKGE